MISIVTEGLDLYEEKLRAYVVWTEERKKAYPHMTNPVGWSRQDYDEIRIQDARLIGMETALGLAKEERDQFLAKCRKGLGLPPTP